MKYVLESVNGKVVMRVAQEKFLTLVTPVGEVDRMSARYKAQLDKQYQHIADLSDAVYKRLPHVFLADNNGQILFSKSGIHLSGESNRYSIEDERVLNKEPYVPSMFPIHPGTYTVVHRAFINCYYGKREYTIENEYELINKKDYNIDGLYRRFHIDEVLRDLA